MKEFEISNNLFNKIVETVGNFTATDDSRPVLRKIQCKVDKDKIEFIAIDGYTGIKYTVKQNNPEIEPFDFVFSPFKVDNFKDDQCQVKIVYSEDKLLFTFRDKDMNEVTKKVRNYGEDFCSYDNVIAGLTPTFEIDFSVTKLSRVLNALKKSKMQNVRLKVIDKTKLMFLEGKPSDDENAQAIILPIRTFD